MRFRDSAPRVLIGTIVLVVLLMAFLSNRLFSGLTSAIEEDQLKLMRSVIDFNVKGAENRALARAELVAGLPSIRSAFAARDREKLLMELQEVFAV